MRRSELYTEPNMYPCLAGNRGLVMPDFLRKGKGTWHENDIEKNWVVLNLTLALKDRQTFFWDNSEVPNCWSFMGVIQRRFDWFSKSSREGNPGQKCRQLGSLQYLEHCQQYQNFKYNELRLTILSRVPHPSGVLGVFPSCLPISMVTLIIPGLKIAKLCYRQMSQVL